MNKKYEYYLINLDRAEERLELMKSEFSKNKIEFKRVSAIDASKISSVSYKINNMYDRELVPGEIGCYLSHIKALQEFLESSNDFAIIMEDDAILKNNFNDIIRDAILMYDNLEKKDRWDILKLKNGKRRNIKIIDVNKDYFIGACGTSVPIFAIGAIWTRVGAEKFFKKTLNPIPIIRRPIDCDLQHPWEYDLLIYNLLPSIIKNAEVETQIQMDKKLRKAKFSKQIIYEAKRIIPKYYYIIKQHGFLKFYKSFILKKTEKVS